MSKRENHWYLAGATLRSVGRAWRPRLSVFVVWLVLVVAFFVLWMLNKDQPERLEFLGSKLLGVGVGLVVVAASVGYFFWVRARFRAGYLRALALPEPRPLIEHVRRSLKGAERMTDFDAMTAQAQALVYTFYGREEDALRLLSAVEWRSKAPIIQSMGLGAEALLTLFCRRDIARALELARRARELGAVSNRLPGAAMGRRVADACVAIPELLAGTVEPEGLRALEECAALSTYPPAQLLGAFGLALWAEKSGDRERAGVMRGFLRQVAPHCAPLHLAVEDFAAGGRTAPQPVAEAVSAAHPPGTQARGAQRQLLGAAGKLVFLWVMLLAAFAVVWLVFKQ